jgi:hypothetical protein
MGTLRPMLKRSRAVTVRIVHVVGLDEISGSRFVFGRTQPLGIANHEVPQRRSCRPVRHDSARIHFRSAPGVG